MLRAAIETAIRETADNFAAIGKRFGVTRERVRQIAAGMGITGRERERQALASKRAQRGYTPREFVIAINRHLALIGCRYCARCHGAAPTSKQGYCRECKVGETRRWEAKNHERKMSWRRANTEKMLAYARKYQQSEKGKARRKRRHLAKRNAI